MKKDDAYQKIFNEIQSNVIDEIEDINLELSETKTNEMEYLKGMRNALKWVKQRMNQIKNEFLEEDA